MQKNGSDLTVKKILICRDGSETGICLVLIYCGFNSPIAAFLRWHLVLTGIHVLLSMYGRT